METAQLEKEEGYVTRIPASWLEARRNAALESEKNLASKLRRKKLFRQTLRKSLIHSLVVSLHTLPLINSVRNGITFGW